MVENVNFALLQLPILYSYPNTPLPKRGGISEDALNRVFCSVIALPLLCCCKLCCVIPCVLYSAQGAELEVTNEETMSSKLL